MDDQIRYGPHPGDILAIWRIVPHWSGGVRLDGSCPFGNVGALGETKDQAIARAVVAAKKLEREFEEHA